MIGKIDASGRNASFVQEDWLAPSYMITTESIMLKMTQRLAQDFIKSSESDDAVKTIGVVVVDLEVH
jgi:hypothetical protein